MHVWSEVWEEHKQTEHFVTAGSCDSLCADWAFKILPAKRMSAMPSAAALLSASSMCTLCVVNVNTWHTESIDGKLYLKSSGGAISLMWLRGVCTGGLPRCRHRGSAEFMTVSFCPCGVKLCSTRICCQNKYSNNLVRPDSNQHNRILCAFVCLTVRQWEKPATKKGIVRLLVDYSASLWNTSFENIFPVFWRWCQAALWNMLLQNLPLILSCMEILWLWRPWHMIHIIFIFIKPFSEPSCPTDGRIVILQETALRDKGDPEQRQINAPTHTS